MAINTVRETAAATRRDILRKLAHEEQARRDEMKTLQEQILPLQQKFNSLERANRNSLEQRVAITAQNLVGLAVVTRGSIFGVPPETPGTVLEAGKMKCTVDFGHSGIFSLPLTDVKGADHELWHRMLLGEV